MNRFISFALLNAAFLYVCVFLTQSCYHKGTLMLPFSFLNDQREFHYITNSLSSLCNVTYSFVRVALGNGTRSGEVSRWCGHIEQEYG